MARLRIERDGVVEQEVDLADRDLRIGRDAGNDIVLDEPSKSVSRVHAELRCEHGRYAVIDLNSRNGIWVSGRQVSRADLGPGVAVAIGLYNLSLDDARSGASPAPAAGPDLSATVVLEEPLTPRVETPSSAPPAAPRAARAPVKPAAALPAGGPIAWLARQPKGLVFGGFAALLVLLIVILSMLRPDPASPPASPAQSAAAPGAPAPSNEQAVTELLEKARAALAAGDLDTAHERVQQALVVVPTHPQALDLRTRVDAERQRRPGPTSPGGPLAGTGADRPGGAAPVAAGDEPVQLEWEIASLEESIRRLRADVSRRAPQLERGVAELEEGLRRVRTRLKLDGDDAYRRARQLEAGGRRDEAFLLYQQALRFWPEDEPDRREARRRLEALRVGR